MTRTSTQLHLTESSPGSPLPRRLFAWLAWCLLLKRLYDFTTAALGIKTIIHLRKPHPRRGLGLGPI